MLNRSHAYHENFKPMCELRLDNLAHHIFNDPERKEMIDEIYRLRSREETELPPTELHYHNIYLVPKKCIVDSRSECDTSVELGPHKFKHPCFPSNMLSVVDDKTCEFLAGMNYFYIHHRFGTDPVRFTQKMHDMELYSSISVGVNDESYEQIAALKEKGLEPEYITIDVANAWADKTHRMMQYIREMLPKSFLIVGNVATRAAVLELTNWGADAIKVGIAGGLSCTTKIHTGFHRPMVNTINDCAVFSNVPIIADGGIRENGDVAKALALGAHMVMAGSLFAGYDESAGDVMSIDGKQYKNYFGNASAEAKGESAKHIEGTLKLIPYKGGMMKLLIELEQDLQSSISYAGGRDISALRSVEIVRCS